MVVLPREWVELVNPGLTIRRRYTGSFAVYKVEMEGDLYVLKGVKTFLAECDQTEHEAILRREGEALRRAREVDGITHLVQAYEGDCGFALLKEYYPGVDLYQQRTRVSDPEVQGALRGTVDDLHACGIGRLDLKRANVVIGTDNRARIVDLSGIQLRENVEREEWMRYLQQDRAALELLF